MTVLVLPPGPFVAPPHEPLEVSVQRAFRSFMHQQQRKRTRQLLEERGIDRALFAHPGSVTWLTGFTPPIQLGSNPFAGGPPLVWYDDGSFTLLVLDGLADRARSFAADPDARLVSYAGYSIEEPPQGVENLTRELDRLLSTSRPRPGRIGLEESHVSYTLVGVVRDRCGDDAGRVPVDGWLAPLRAVKTPEELIKLRANFALTDVGHAVARETVCPGIREIDLWTEIHLVVEQVAGERVPLGNDCIVGRREANVGGWPSDYEIKPEDSVIVDLSTVLHGYWSDSCATYYAGEPSPRQKKLHRIAEEALELAVSMIRPGATAREIDRQIREFIARSGHPIYPHHTGHGVGVSGHEAPRIVPYNEQRLEAGMVILLEPGIYFSGETGVRLEDAVLVTETGCERLTRHDKSLP